MGVNDLITTSYEREAASDGLVSSERTDAVNSGIVGKADKSAETLKPDLFSRGSRGAEAAGGARGELAGDMQVGTSVGGVSSAGVSGGGADLVTNAVPGSGLASLSTSPQKADAADVLGGKDGLFTSDKKAKASSVAQSAHAVAKARTAGLVTSAARGAAAGGNLAGGLRRGALKGGTSSMLRGSELEGADDMVENVVGGVRAVKRVGQRLSGGKAAHAATEGAGKSGLGQLTQKRYQQAKSVQAKQRAAQSMRNQMVAQRNAAAAKAAAAGKAGAGKTVAAAAAKVGGSGIGALLAPVAGTFLSALGGIASMLLILAILGGVIASLGHHEVENTVGPLAGNEMTVAQFLLDKGLDTTHVAAIMGNMRAESGGEPGDAFDTGSIEQGGGGGHGLCQWTGSRWDGYSSDGVKVTTDNLLDFATSQGKSWTDIEVQLEFFWREYSRDWSGSYVITNSASDDPPPGSYVTGSKSSFESTSNLNDATRSFCYGWERPGIPRMSKRVAFAEQYYTMLTSTAYVQAAIAIANDDSHGYSMSNRTFNPDVDCSSFVYYSLLNSGYTTDRLGESPFSTYTMGAILVGAGFDEHEFTSSSDLQPGDILVADGHTEIYIGDGQNVGAHDDYDGRAGDSSGDEVSIGPYYAGGWHHYYRKAA